MSELAAVDRVDAMRREFDESFAVPAEAGSRAVERSLSIRVAGNPYLLPFLGLDAVLFDRTIVPVPTSFPIFIGMIGHRGALIPVFDLASILGYGRAASAKWVVLARSGDLPVGFAFDVFEGQIELPAIERRAEEVRKHIAGVVVVDGVVRPLLDIGSLLEALPRQSAIPRKER